MPSATFAVAESPKKAKRSRCKRNEVSNRSNQCTARSDALEGLRINHPGVGQHHSKSLAAKRLSHCQVKESDQSDDDSSSHTRPRVRETGGAADQNHEGSTAQRNRHHVNEPDNEVHAKRRAFVSREFCRKGPINLSHFSFEIVDWLYLIGDNYPGRHNLRR